MTRGAELLTRWLETNGIAQDSFAAALDIDAKVLGIWLAGRRPGAAMVVGTAAAIEAVTSGAVPALAWTSPDPLAKRVTKARALLRAGGWTDEASQRRLSPRSEALREAVLASLRSIRRLATTARVLDDVEERRDKGQLPGLGIVDRHEIRSALVGLEALGLVRSHKSGAVEYSHGRRSSREHERAARGSVKWSIPRESGTSGEPAW